MGSERSTGDMHSGPDIATGMLTDPELVNSSLWDSFPLTLWFFIIVNLDRKDGLLLCIGIMSVLTPVLPAVSQCCYNLVISLICSDNTTVECKSISLYYY